MQGIISDKVEALVGASVKLSEGGEVIVSRATGIDGDYKISTEPGVYDVEFSYTGYNPQRFEGQTLAVGKTLELNVLLNNAKIVEWGCYFGWKVPLIIKDGTESGLTITSDQIKQMF